MRRFRFILALVGIAATTPLASAQSALSPLSGANATQTVNKPIDLSQAIAPAAPPSTQKGSIFTRFLPKISFPGLSSRSSKPVVQPVAPPDKMPGAPYSSPLKPVAPTSQRLPALNTR